MSNIDIENLIKEHKIKIGMTKKYIQQILGEPDAVGGTSRKYREPSIWKYGYIEFFFSTQKGNPLPNLGAKLYMIYTDTINGWPTEPRVLLEERDIYS